MGMYKRGGGEQAKVLCLINYEGNNIITQVEMQEKYTKIQSSWLM
jgi:hypothetical protein